MFPDPSDRRYWHGQANWDAALQMAQSRGRDGWAHAMAVASLCERVARAAERRYHAARCSYEGARNGSLVTATGRRGLQFVFSEDEITQSRLKYVRLHGATREVRAQAMQAWHQTGLLPKEIGFARAAVETMYFWR
jgi:hypothetical protein